MTLTLKSLLDKMISKSGKSDKVTILQNTWFFTVKLHLRYVDYARKHLPKPPFSRSVIDRHERACLDRLQASIWESFGQPKSVPKRAGNRADGHWIVDIDFERIMATVGGEGALRGVPRGQGLGLDKINILLQSSTGVLRIEGASRKLRI